MARSIDSATDWQSETANKGDHVDWSCNAVIDSDDPRRVLFRYHIKENNVAIGSIRMPSAVESLTQQDVEAIKSVLSNFLYVTEPQMFYFRPREYEHQPCNFEMEGPNFKINLETWMPVQGWSPLRRYIVTLAYNRDFKIPLHPDHQRPIAIYLNEQLDRWFIDNDYAVDDLCNWLDENEEFMNAHEQRLDKFERYLYEEINPPM